MIDWLKTIFRKFRKTVIPPTMQELPNGRTARVDDKGNFLGWSE